MQTWLMIYIPLQIMFDIWAVMTIGTAQRFLSGVIVRAFVGDEDGILHRIDKGGAEDDKDNRTGEGH